MRRRRRCSRPCRGTTKRTWSSMCGKVLRTSPTQLRPTPPAPAAPWQPEQPRVHVGALGERAGGDLRRLGAGVRAAHRGRRRRRAPPSRDPGAPLGRLDVGRSAGRRRPGGCAAAWGRRDRSGGAAAGGGSAPGGGRRRRRRHHPRPPPRRRRPERPAGAAGALEEVFGDLGHCACRRSAAARPRAADSRRRSVRSPTVAGDALGDTDGGVGRRGHLRTTAERGTRSGETAFEPDVQVSTPDLCKDTCGESHRPFGPVEAVIRLRPRPHTSLVD